MYNPGPRDHVGISKSWGKRGVRALRRAALLQCPLLEEVVVLVVASAPSRDRSLRPQLALPS
jgi:hypothetical protein